jgi:hypothetical protein
MFSQMFWCSVSFCLLSFVSASSRAQSLPLRAGAYDISTSMTIGGQAGEPTRDRRCLSKELLANVENVFNVRPMAGVCQVSSLAITSKKVSYRADCPNTLVQVAGVVNTDAYSVIRTQKAKQAKASEVLTKFEGKFAGAC